jgi:hypothetical protein
MPEETITISMSEYNGLKRRSRELEALEEYGVDNWQGFEDAMHSIEDEEENDN